MSKTVFVLALGVAAITLVAHAEDRWLKVGSSNGFPSFLDTTSFAKIDDASFHLWIKSVTPDGVDDQIDGYQTDYSLQNFEINCPKNLVTTKRIIVYGKNGKRLYDELPNSIKPIEPESFVEMVAQNMCPKLNPDYEKDLVEKAQSEGRAVCIEASDVEAFAPIAEKEGLIRYGNCFVYPEQ